MVLGFTTPGIAKEKMLQISEKTKFYTISGKTAGEFAASMSRRGPFSFQHRKRAWATAARNVTYQIIHQKFKKNCRIKDVKVKLDITYTMPKLGSTTGVSRRQLRVWKKMYGLLNKHERTHGLYYKQLAKQIRRSVRRMKPSKTCLALTKRADALVNKISEQNKRLNDRFDARDRTNYRRMLRLQTSS